MTQTSAAGPAARTGQVQGPCPRRELRLASALRAQRACTRPRGRGYRCPAEPIRARAERLGGERSSHCGTPREDRQALAAARDTCFTFV